jgi:hypothetical protein
MPEESEILEYVSLPIDEELTAYEEGLLEGVNQKIAAVTGVPQAVDYLFRATGELYDLDRMSIAFIEDHTRVVSYYTHAEYSPILLKTGYAEDLHGSSLEQIIRSGQVRLLHDLQAYAEQNPQSRSTKLLLREGIRSSMTCPLTVDDRNIGLLFLSSRKPRSFDHIDIRRHQDVAERLSQAVEKAWRIEQLQAANTAYMEMLGFVTHELRSPVSSLVMTAELLRDGSFGEVQPKQQEKLDRILFQGQYLLTLIRDYLNLAKMETGQMDFNPEYAIPFTERVLEPAIAMVQPWLDGKEMTLEREYNPVDAVIDGDPDLLAIVATNLLNNAAKYGNKGGTIRCGFRRTAEEFAFWVWNSGPGFSEEQREKLFRKFSRLQDPALRKAKGTGVGLYTVWRIINQHGGRVFAESEQGAWARFGFTLAQPLQCPLLPEEETNSSASRNAP